MSDASRPVWGSGRLPGNVQKLGDGDGQVHQRRFDGMTTVKKDSVYQSPWPKPGVAMLAIQDGFKESAGNAKNMDRLFQSLSPGGIVCWATNDPGVGYFKSTFDGSFRAWLDSGLVISPVSAMALDEDLALVIDDLLVFTLIIGVPSLIDQVAGFFGGKDKMQSRFIESREDYYDDPDDRLGKWIRENVESECAW